MEMIELKENVNFFSSDTSDTYTTMDVILAGVTIGFTAEQDGHGLWVFSPEQVKQVTAFAYRRGVLDGEIEQLTKQLNRTVPF
jgi:hypothetical protein